MRSIVLVQCEQFQFRQVKPAMALEKDYDEEPGLPASSAGAANYLHSGGRQCSAGSCRIHSAPAPRRGSKLSRRSSWLRQGLPDLAGDTANDLAKDFAGLGIRKMDDFRQMPQVVWGSSVYCVGHPRVAIMGMWSWHGLATRGSTCSTTPTLASWPPTCSSRPLCGPL
eukprot:s2593_g6.t2